MIYFVIQKVDIIFSTLIPNFFFKVSNTKDQAHKINLNKKSVLPTQLVNSFNNDFAIEDNVLLMALYLHKASMSLSTFNYNFYSNKIKYNTFLLNLNIIPGYKENVLSTIFLITKGKHNNYYNYRFNLSEYNDSFNLKNSSFSYLKIFESTIDFHYMYNSNFQLQKFISNNISKNLNLSKQSRWL